jgi:alkanesulfonate monooxygenase SsuD/methylene tetrahydromethanopterin reductase-like flavin-dependent oxidoreductase (luciferase family)
LTDVMVRRIATLGDGWLPLGPTVDEIAAGIEVLRDAFRAVGRDPRALGVRAGLPVVTDDDGRVDPAATVAVVPDLAAIGVTSVSVALGRFIRTREDIEPFLTDLVAALHS